MFVKFIMHASYLYTPLINIHKLFPRTDFKKNLFMMSQPQMKKRRMSPFKIQKFYKIL